MVPSRGVCQANLLTFFLWCERDLCSCLHVSIIWLIKCGTPNNGRYLCSNTAAAPKWACALWGAVSCLCVFAGRLTCPLVSELHAGNAAAFPRKCFISEVRKVVMHPPRNRVERRSLCVSGIFNMHSSCDSTGLMLFPYVFCKKLVYLCTSFHLLFSSENRGKATCFPPNYVLYFTWGLLFPIQEHFRVMLWLMTSHLQHCHLLWNAASGYRFIELLKSEKTAKIIESNS